jgi:hypothetical protein
MQGLSWFSEDFDSHFLTVSDWQCIVIEIHMYITLLSNCWGLMKSVVMVAHPAIPDEGAGLTHKVTSVLKFLFGN